MDFSTLERLKHAPLRDLTEIELKQAFERDLVTPTLYAADCRRRRRQLMVPLPAMPAAGLVRES